MKTKTKDELLAEIEGPRARLEKAEGDRQVIRSAKDDPPAISKPQGDRIFSLEGEDHPYRIFVETMNEGALILAADGGIVYCNKRFVEIVQTSSEKLNRASIFDFVPTGRDLEFHALFQKGREEGSQFETFLCAQDGSLLPVFFSLTPLPGGGASTICAVVTDLTEQKRNEQIVAAERLSRLVLEQAGEAILVCDETGKIVRASLMAHWISAKNPLRQLFDIVIPLQLSPTSEEPTRAFSILDALRGKVFQGRQVQFTRHDGTVLHLLLSTGTLLNERSEVLGCVVTLSDISQYKKMEEEIAHLASFPRLSPDVIMELDASGNICYLNPIAERLFPDIRSAGLKHPWFRDLAWETLIFAEGRRSSQTREIAIGETWYHQTLCYTPEWHRIRIYGLDITRRKRAEEALRRSRDELEILVQERTAELARACQELKEQATAIEQTVEGIAILDLDLRIFYVNGAFERLHNLPRKGALGRNYREFLSGNTKGEDWPTLMLETLRKGKAWNGRFIQSLEDKISLEIEVTISPVRDSSGEIIHYVVVERDVTQDMKIQEHLRQWQRMEALGTLAGGIAHDFNNILMPIAINTDLALLDIREGKSPAPHCLELVQEAAKRGQELVKQIITFSRQKEQLRRPEEITPIIKEGLKFLRATIPKNIEIREHIDAPSALLLADATQIHQVLINLCSNAAHAMRRKGGILEVSLSQVEADADMTAQYMDLSVGPYIRLTVSDTGHGMDPEVRERAFDPFFTTKKPGEGTGMGLAVVHGIVRNHEGAIRIYSEVGKGTTVHVFLPRIQGEVEPQVVSSGPIPAGKERILLVDDEEIQVRSVQNMLDRLGYRVIGKTDSRQALEVFRAQPDSFDLVITDQTMPHLLGQDLAREMLSIRPDLPIILCTGFSELIHEEEAKAAGIRDFAMKPLTLRDMAVRIRRALKE